MTSEANVDATFHLLQRWNSGDAHARDELIRRHVTWIHSYVRSRLRPELRREQETVDFVQEAMLDVLNYGPRFEVRTPERFRALIARIVENNLVDRHRWLHSQRRDVERERPGLSDTVLQLDPPAASITSPSEHAQRQERAEWIRLALALLEPIDRDVIWLREWEKLGFEEVGERVGLHADAARMRYRRALPRLAEKVDQLRRGGVDSLLE